MFVQRFNRCYIVIKNPGSTAEKRDEFPFKPKKCIVRNTKLDFAKMETICRHKKIIEGLK